MSEISFEYLKNTAFLGGLGTGCLKLDNFGNTQFAGLTKTASRRAHPGENSDPVSFAVCVRRDEPKPDTLQTDISCVILKAQEADNSKTAVSLPHTSPHFRKHFPFAYFDFNQNETAVKINMTAFNPTILHNSVDSGIPAAFFEFTLTNSDTCGVTVSLCALLKSFFSAGKAVLQYDNTNGVFYTELSETAKSVSARRRGSLVLATNQPNFTYEISPEASNDIFFEAFCHKNGFLANRFLPDAAKNMASMVSCHLHLEPGQSEKVRFLVAWHFPYLAESPAKSGEKNYYCHYFSDIGTCVSYCFTHFDRLWRESERLTKLAGNKASIPDALRPYIDCALGCVKDPALRRDSAGVIKAVSGGIAEEGNAAEKNDAGNTPVLSFALEYLFPGITIPTSVQALKNLLTAKGRQSDSNKFVPTAFDTDCTPYELCARFYMVMRLYYAYKTCSELKFFSENWVDIACMMDLLCENARHLKAKDNDSFMPVYAVMLPALSAMVKVAELLRDKRRRIAYNDVLKRLKMRFDQGIEAFCETNPSALLATSFTARYMCSYTLYTPKILQKAANGVESHLTQGFPDHEFTFLTCAELIHTAQTAFADKALRTEKTALYISYAERLCREEFSQKKDLYTSAMHLCALVPAFSGLEYDKNTMELALAPAESLAGENRIFRGFVSFDGAYGWAEQGEDYLELILHTGEIKVRKFSASHRPYRVMYGGRFWTCEIDKNTVTLDSNLNVTKVKKLTLLIDTTK